MILYTYFRSSAAFRVRIALKLKGIDAELRSINLLTNENWQAGYLGINPQGFVPFLIDGDVRLSQSMAIIEYLEETRPAPALLPHSATDRAFVRGIANLIACDIHPLNNKRIMDYLEHPLGQDKTVRSNWYQHWIREGFDVLENQLVARHGDTFCFGNTPTLADICLVPQVFNAQRFKVDTSRYPRIMQIFDSCMQLDAFVAAQPSRQPDSV